MNVLMWWAAAPCVFSIPGCTVAVWAAPYVQGLSSPYFSCHRASSRWSVTQFVSILVERQQGRATQKSVTSEIASRWVFTDTEESLILEDGALDLVKLELLSDNIGLPLLSREQAGALVFQIRCLRKMGEEVQSSVCVWSHSPHCTVPRCLVIPLRSSGIKPIQSRSV